MNEAELVLTHVLNCDRLSLYLNKDASLDTHKSAQVLQILKRRITGEPLQYILGTTEFMGYEFKVDPRVLIPRPETEILVSCAQDKLKSTGKAAGSKILDLGTGSGCIAICLAKLFPQAEIWATDLSESALQLAQENARLHQVKIKFLAGDIFNALNNNSEKFDLIISNPPYICQVELSGLAKEISFEPVLALAGGLDGLDFYRRIISQAAGYLNIDGLLAMEVGANQAASVRQICGEHNFNVLAVIKDYNHIQRVVIAQQRTLAHG